MWMDLVLVSVALVPWWMQSKAKRDADAALTPVPVEIEAEPAERPHPAQEF